MKNRHIFVTVSIIVSLVFLGYLRGVEIVGTSLEHEAHEVNELYIDERVINWGWEQNVIEIKVNGYSEFIQNPDGITRVQATNGLIGWSLTVELDGGIPLSVEDTVLINERNRFDRYVDVFADDMITVIGQFRVSGWDGG